MRPSCNCTGCKSIPGILRILYMATHWIQETGIEHLKIQAEFCQLILYFLIAEMNFTHFFNFFYIKAKKKCSLPQKFNIWVWHLVHCFFLFIRLFCFSLPICGSFSSLVNENIPSCFITHLPPPTTDPMKVCSLKSSFLFFGIIETISCLFGFSLPLAHKVKKVH